MANGDFDERMRYLSEEVGVGTLIARCTVNQPYAQKIHEDRNMYHRNGVAGYLGDPLMANALSLVEQLATNAITSTGSDLKDSMSDIAEQMAKYVLQFAPKDTGRLSQSGHAEVIDNGIPIYDRPSVYPRINN
jgi:hypothetical protein